MAPKGEYTTIAAAGHEIRLSSPSKIYFAKQPGEPKRVQPSRARNEE